MGENRFCSRCGKKLNEDEDVSFCPKCGKPIISDYQEIINQARYSQKYTKKKSDGKLRNTLVIVIASLVLITGLGILYLFAEYEQKKIEVSSQNVSVLETTEQVNTNIEEEAVEEPSPDNEPLDEKSVSEDGIKETVKAKADTTKDKESKKESDDAEEDDESDNKSDKDDKKDKEDKKEDETSTGHRYELVVGNITWIEAEKTCREKGGYLATILSDDELKDIQKLIIKEEKTGISFFVGCTRDRDYVGENVGYCWIQKKDDKYETSPVLANLWLTDEPSYSGHDAEGIIIEEKYVDIVYREEKERVYLNDVSNDVIGQAPGFAGRIGYICEFEK